MSDLILNKSAHLDIFGHDFEQGQRIAKAMVNSLTWQAKFAKDSKGNPIAPETQVSTAMTILDMSYRLGISWSEVMQNGSITNGKWTWASEYIVAHVMNSPKYKDFEYDEKIVGKCKPENGQEMENWSCKLVGIRHDGKRDEGSEVSYAMAIADGWWGRSHSKWPRMPRKMLRARAIAFFNREWPTATLLGFKSQEEQEDSIEFTDAVVGETTQQQPRKPKAAPTAAPTHVVTVTEAVTIDVQETDDLKAEKADQRKLAGDDADWLAAIEAAETMQELNKARADFDL